MHLDKGSLLEHAQELNTAKEAWDKSWLKRAQGRPQKSTKKPAADATLAKAEDDLGGKQVRSLGVMLTYNGVTDQQQWKRFLAAFVSLLPCSRHGRER